MGDAVWIAVSVAVLSAPLGTCLYICVTAAEPTTRRTGVDGLPRPTGVHGFVLRVKEMWTSSTSPPPATSQRSVPPRRPPRSYQDIILARMPDEPEHPLPSSSGNDNNVSGQWFGWRSDRSQRIDALFDSLALFEAGPQFAADSCPICLDKLESSLIAKGPCMHAAHVLCLRDWLSKMREHKCPVCRSSLAPQ